MLNLSKIKKISLFILVFALVLPTSSFAEWVPGKAKVNYLMGSATQTKPNGRESKLRKGSRIRLKDTIKVAEKSRLELIFEDGTLLAMAENTHFVLKNYVRDVNDSTNRKVSSKLAKGGIYFNVVPLKTKEAHFEFESETATAAVRGTEGGIERGTEGEIFYLDEGALEVERQVPDSTQDSTAKSSSENSKKASKKTTIKGGQILTASFTEVGLQAIEMAGKELDEQLKAVRSQFGVSAAMALFRNEVNKKFKKMRKDAINLGLKKAKKAGTGLINSAIGSFGF